MSFHVLDPTAEHTPEPVNKASRLATLDGKRIGFISNGKEGTKRFFAYLEQLLFEEAKVSNLVIRIKSNYSAPAEPDIIDEARSWDLAVTGIGD